MIHGDGKGWAARIWSFLFPYIPGVMNPHAQLVQRWNQFFVLACSFAVFLDPMFFFLLVVQQVSFLKQLDLVFLICVGLHFQSYCLKPFIYKYRRWQTSSLVSYDLNITIFIQENKCIVLNWPMTTAMIVLRSMTDFIYLLHILLQVHALPFVVPCSMLCLPGLYSWVLNHFCTIMIEKTLSSQIIIILRYLSIHLNFIWKQEMWVQMNLC